METLFPDWKDFLQLLISHQVKFLLIGSHAVAIHAKPRFTEDLDVWIEASSENAQRVRTILIEFGFGSVAPSIEELVLPNKVFMLGRKPNRIDMLTTISGVTFDEAWPTRTTIDLGFGEIPEIGKEALVKNKVASSRPKDLLDIQWLSES